MLNRQQFEMEGCNGTLLSDENDAVHVSEDRPGDSSVNDDDEPECRVYKRRWYIVGIFSLLAATQCVIGNTWGPIADSAKVVLGWTDSNVALVSNCGCFAYILLAVPFSWLLDVKGLRTSVLFTAFFVFVGTGVRCFTLEEPVATWLIYLGQFLNGCAGPVTLAAPPLISATWFPPEQRTTATAIAGLLGNVGCALSYVIGPLAMSQKTNDMGNLSHALLPTETIGINGTNNTDTKQVAWDISRLMYVEFGWSALLFLAILLYFPACPPSPPSLSASKSRLDFLSGVKGLTKSYSFWLLCLSYGMVQGSFGGWGNILFINVSPYNVTQVEAGWVGFSGNMVGCVASLVLGRLGDYFSGHFKLMLVILALLQAVTMLWFTFMVNINLIPFNVASLYATFCLVQVCLNGSGPLFFEMSVEITYPVAEGITTIVLTWVFYLFCLLVLLLPMAPSLGVAWVNWMTLGATFVVIPMLCCFKERYGRLSIDLAKNKKKHDSEKPTGEDISDEDKQALNL